MGKKVRKQLQEPEAFETALREAVSEATVGVDPFALDDTAEGLIKRARISGYA